VSPLCRDGLSQGSVQRLSYHVEPFLCGGARLQVGVKGAQPVARAAGPVFVDGNDRGGGRQQDALARFKPRLPEVCLALRAGADDDDIVARAGAVDFIDVALPGVGHMRV
jgi:hypothetical protein